MLYRGCSIYIVYCTTVRKVGNKLWLTKRGRRPVVNKRKMSTKKVLYCILFSGNDLAVQIPVQKAKNVTDQYYRDAVLENFKKFKKCYQERRPVSGFRHVRLIHDNMLHHIRLRL